LSDIQEAVERITDYTAGMTYEAFMKERKTQDAVIRNLEIVGEATKNLSSEVRQKHSAVAWKGMAWVKGVVDARLPDGTTPTNTIFVADVTMTESADN